MRFVALIIAECRCIGTLGDAFLKKSNKGRSVLNMVHILSRILQRIWSLNMEVVFLLDNWSVHGSFIAFTQLRPHCGRN